MQADNLTETDVEKFKEFFEEKIQPDNPEARMRIFDSVEADRKKFHSLPKDCLFKKSCRPYNRGNR